MENHRLEKIDYKMVAFKANKESPLFAGFDLSIKCTGFSILNSKGDLVFSEVFKEASKVPFDSLDVISIYNNYFSKIVKFLFPFKNNLYISIEQLNVFRPSLQKLTNAMAQLHGILLSQICKEFPKNRIKIINNVYIKKFITGSGNAKKDQMCQAIEKLYPVTDKINIPEREGRADSIATAYVVMWAWNYFKSKKITLPEKHLINFSNRADISHKIAIEEQSQYFGRRTLKIKEKNVFR